MYHNHYTEWVKRMCGGATERIAEFWESQTKHPAYATHPMHMHRSSKKKGVPLAMHGDGVTVLGEGKKHQKHLDCLSWVPILADPSFTLCTKSIVFLMFQMLCLKSGRIDGEVWQVVCWSFYWLYVGRWPDRDHTGRLYTSEDGEDWHRRLTFLADGLFWNLLDQTC